MRVLVALTPRMYREAVALSIHQGRPGLDVRAAPPGRAEAGLDSFRPHLLVHNDTAPVSEEALSGVPCRVEVLYSDSMNVRTHAGGREEEARDMGVAGLLGVVDETARLLEGDAPAADGRGPSTS